MFQLLPLRHRLPTSLPDSPADQTPSRRSPLRKQHRKHHPPHNHAICSRTQSNQLNHPLNTRIAIHSAGGPFSDENSAVVIGYLILRHLYTFQKAFDAMNGLYQKYKGDKHGKLSLSKVYADQLLNLEGRVLITSQPNYGVTLNSSNWRVFQVSNNHCSPAQNLIARFVLLLLFRSDR